jgi:hypothetical protein
MESKRPGTFDFAGPLWEVLDRWSAAQQAVGSQAHALFEAWMKCRTADVENGMAFYASMAGCRDPAMMLHLQQRWLLDAANRLQAEFEELGGNVAKLATEGLDKTVAPAPAAKRDAAE